jgi:hypothetical protein
MRMRITRTALFRVSSRVCRYRARMFLLGTTAVNTFLPAQLVNLLRSALNFGFHPEERTPRCCQSCPQLALVAPVFRWFYLTSWPKVCRKLQLRKLCIRCLFSCSFAMQTIITAKEGNTYYMRPRGLSTGLADPFLKPILI